MSIAMNRKDPLHGPKHWLQRAEATLAKAESFACPRSKGRLLKIADEYYELARSAAERERLTNDAN